jgi:hypothetical protein
MNQNIDVGLKDIPDYLKETIIYRNLIEDVNLDNNTSQESFRIPYIYLKSDLNVGTLEEFEHLLHTLKFWLVEDIPYEVLDIFIMDDKTYLIENNKLNKIFMDYDILQKLKKINRYKNTLPFFATKTNDLYLLNYCYTRSYAFDTFLYDYAIENHNLEIIKYLFENVKIALDQELLYITTLKGNFEILKYLVENNCPKYYDIAIVAIKCGKLNYLKYLYENNYCIIDKRALKCALINDNNECKSYIKNILKNTS